MKALTFYFADVLIFILIAMVIGLDCVILSHRLSGYRIRKQFTATALFFIFINIAFSFLLSCAILFHYYSMVSHSLKLEGQ